ncbi:hypothetical protein ADL21_11175 [Streptomyces albus subsp. albus]|nr:hypothetical protein ADL21_11175 [Streptomyces albus subsp. albus]
MLYRSAAVACLAGGVLILAGPGWALLVLGALLGSLAPDREAQPLLLGSTVARLRRTAARLAEAPRRTAAVASLSVGAVGVPTGVLLLYGSGAAVLCAGAALVGISLLTGWNA